jgi:PST family polysaccharide transporter
LAGRVASAARWSALNTVLLRLGNFAIGIVLARYFLGPREWGLYAVGLVVLMVLLSANEMGVSLAMVRWEGDARRFAPTVLTLSVASSVLLYAALYGCAPLLARALGSANATTMLRVLCFSVVIDGLACVPSGVITRNFAQHKRMVLDLANFLVSGTVTMVLAVVGAGAMSFAWGAVAGNTVFLIGAAIAAPGMLRFGWDPVQARELLRFGLPLAGASLLVLAMLNVDSAVVGATLGPTALGLYQIAFNVSSWPVRSVSEAARRVSFASFSRLADSPDRLADGFNRALMVVMVAAVPACVLLGTLAEPVIRTIYGTQWLAAAGPLRFLAALGLARVAFELAYDCLGAAGRRKALILVQGWWLVTLVPVLIIAARHNGITGVGAGQALVAVLLVAPFFLVALSRIGISGRAVARACALPFLGGAGCGLVAWGLHRQLGDSPASLIVAGFAALLTYLLVISPLLRQLRTLATDRGVAQAAEPDDAPGTATPVLASREFAPVASTPDHLGEH